MRSTVSIAARTHFATTVVVGHSQCMTLPFVVCRYRPGRVDDGKAKGVGRRLAELLKNAFGYCSDVVGSIGPNAARTRRGTVRSDF